MDRLFVPLMFVFVAWMTSSVDADIGSNCSATTECDPVNNTATVCDTTANTFVCKVGAGSVCNGTQCVENAVCIQFARVTPTTEPTRKNSALKMLHLVLQFR
ncbi:hypothetical protein MAR_007600 [Mya arenaria]|uniref:Antifreeze protein n=1 Tax=Mya arenaria TaxID=6604 RepID=A0ABY7DBT6_MYAAR|nr:uncharacterized protein LOC128235420 [Mya arenaria]WAQ95129.1 hypothetical protein MAR_007600 [Mya arenaria]